MSGDTKTLPREFIHQNGKALVDLTQEGIGGESHVSKKQQCGIRGVLANFFNLLGFFEAWCMRVNEEQ